MVPSVVAPSGTGRWRRTRTAGRPCTRSTASRRFERQASLAAFTDTERSFHSGRNLGAGVRSDPDRRMKSSKIPPTTRRSKRNGSSRPAAGFSRAARVTAVHCRESCVRRGLATRSCPGFSSRTDANCSRVQSVPWRRNTRRLCSRALRIRMAPAQVRGTVAVGRSGVMRRGRISCGSATNGQYSCWIVPWTAVQVREYQNSWGPSSRHRRLERPNADPERLCGFQTEDGFAV